MYRVFNQPIFFLFRKKWNDRVNCNINKTFFICVVSLNICILKIYIMKMDSKKFASMYLKICDNKNLLQLSPWQYSRGDKFILYFVIVKIVHRLYKLIDFHRLVIVYDAICKLMNILIIESESGFAGYGFC